MIDNCVQLVNDARVVRAYLEEGGRGIVLAKYHGRYVVWRVFRAKKAILWNCTHGRYTKERDEAELIFAEMVADALPETSCPECGYWFNDPEEGCDACAHRKKVLSTTVGAVGT